MERDADALRALFTQTADVMSELREHVRTCRRLRAQARALRRELQRVARAVRMKRPGRR
jgi:hypothetical protein